MNAATKAGVDDLQREVLNWTIRNFKDGKPLWPVMGQSEEIGELFETILLLHFSSSRITRAALKMDQGIRGTREEHLAKMKDAIGDTVIFLNDVCNKYHINFADCISMALEEIKQRDWVANSHTGKLENNARKHIPATIDSAVPTRLPGVPSGDED